MNGKNSLGQVDSHIEDYRTKEIMEERFSRIKETFRNHRPALQGNASILAGTEYQARMVIVQADWQAGAQDEQNENEVR